MRQRTALRYQHRDHAAFGQLRQFRRCHGVADQHIAGQADHGAVVWPGLQCGLHPADQVFDVLAPRAQIGIVHRLEDRRQPVALQLQRVRGAVVFVADHAGDAGEQFRIVQQQRVDIEEFAQFRGQRAVQLIAQLQQRLAGAGDGLMQTFDFRIDFVWRKVALFDIQPLRFADPGTPQRQALGDGDTGKRLAHVSGRKQASRRAGRVVEEGRA